MNKKITILGILIILIVLISGFIFQINKNTDSNNLNTQINTSKYDETLNRLYTVIVSDSSEEETYNGEVGILEATIDLGKAEALDKIGYTITDINEDDIPELIIADISKTQNEKSYGSFVYALYTLDNDTPSLVFEGRYRNSYKIMNNKKFFFEGSGGAMYSIIGVYSFPKDSKNIKVEDYYFTYEKDISFNEIGLYHNTSGIYKKEVSEELDIDKLESIRENFASQVVEIELTPFSKFKTETTSDIMKTDSKVFINYENAVQYNKENCEKFTADNFDTQVKVLFSTTESVKDFKFLELQLDEVDKNGKISFLEKEIYSLKNLTNEKPLVVDMTFFGDTPNYGISYVDNNGNTKKFAIQMSGEDSSLLLVEF